MDNKNYIFPESRELGEPLPNCTHAVSVSLPKWHDVVGYEEAAPRVINALKSGYPRFSFHPITEQLFKQALTHFGKEGQSCLVLPSKKSADECAKYIEDKANFTCDINRYEPYEIYVVTFDSKLEAIAKEFWQHTGLIICSRQAEDILNNQQPTDDANSDKLEICQKLAELNNQPEENIYLYPNGMASIYAIYQALCKCTPNAKTIQLGFAYVDTLKIQEKFNSGSIFVEHSDDDYINQIAEILKNEPIAAVFCEIPSNPELKTIDIAKLSNLLQEYNVPLVIDDTVAAWQVNINDYADIIVTSLTKYFSGVGDVLGGSLIFNKKSPFTKEIKSLIDSSYEDILYPRDATILNSNSDDLNYRINKINQTTEIIIDYLSKNKLIDKIYYPKNTTKNLYDSIRKKDGGYGGLFSITFKNSYHAHIFYDSLKSCKGPSLGTNFTLICPYILLAHYYEQEVIKKYGISPQLIRVSIGLEEPEEIISDFEQALKTILTL